MFIATDFMWPACGRECPPEAQPSRHEFESEVDVLLVKRQLIMHELGHTPILQDVAIFATKVMINYGVQSNLFYLQTRPCGFRHFLSANRRNVQTRS